MSDYISREAAIAYIREQSEELQKAFEELGGESGIYADAYNDLAEDFHRIPAADVAEVRRGRWIPCSERLPESDEVWGKYIVVYRYSCPSIWDDISENVSVTVADYCHEQKVWSMAGGEVINALIDSENVHPFASCITHWMPLPEPPKEDKNGRT